MENLKEVFKKHYWIFLLILIFLSALWIRCIPGTKLTYPRLLAIDPYYFFRMGEYIIENGTLPENDYLAQWGTAPGGPDRRNGFIVALWAYPIVYFILHPLFGISWYWVGVWAPAFFGALQVLFVYFLAKELFGSKKIGLLSAIFLASVPGILYRVSAGFMDKEPVAGIFMVLGLYFFVKSLKVGEIRKDISWKHILLHPLSLIHRANLEDEKLRTIKTIIYAAVSGVLFALMTGVSGIVRIPLLLIAIFVVVSLLFDLYPKILFKSYVPFFIAFFLVSRIFSVAPSITSESMVGSFMAIAFLVIRYVVERFRLVKEEYLKYVIPCIFLLSLFSVAIASYMYAEIGEWVGLIIAKIFNPLTTGVISSTVAESQTAGEFIRSTLSTFGTEYAVRALSLPTLIVYLSVIYFAALGVIFMAYEFLFRKRKLEYILVVLMFISFMILARGAQRLNFVFAFPVSIAAGYFLVRGGSYVMKWSSGFLKGRGQHYLKIAGGVFIGLVVFTNFAAGWVMANSITTSLTNDWYEALIWLRDNTPEDAVLLEWWDFGWWYQYVAKKITLVDGGFHNRKPVQDIAQFYTRPLSDTSLNFLKNYSVDYVMVSHDLIPKFGAMSKIANWGAKIDVLPVFNLVNTYQEGNKILLEYSGGGQTILVAYSISGEGNATTMENITALIKTPQGQAYVENIGVGNYVIKNSKPNSIPGMVYFAGNAVIYIPESVQDCVFVRLYLFDGSGMEEYFKKVYDKMGIKIYEVLYENFPENITGEYINAADR